MIFSEKKCRPAGRRFSVFPILQQRAAERKDLRLIQRVPELHGPCPALRAEHARGGEPAPQLHGDAVAAVQDLRPAADDPADRAGEERIMRAAEHDRIDRDLEVRPELIEQIRVQRLAAQLAALDELHQPAAGQADDLRLVVKTTYNVGVIEGGTSVNTIAQEASMLCEYRSNDRECLETMRVFFEKTFEAYRAMGVEVEVTLVGDRPCGGDVPQEKLDALIARADSAVRELFDAEPIHGPSSTDANIPLAAGIPAICVSAAVGRGCHTRQEEIDLDQLPNGAKLSMRLMQEYFEI